MSKRQLRVFFAIYSVVLFALAVAAYHSDPALFAFLQFFRVPVEQPNAPMIICAIFFCAGLAFATAASGKKTKYRMY